MAADSPIPPAPLGARHPVCAQFAALMKELREGRLEARDGGDLAAGIAGTSSSSNAVSTLSQGADGGYSQDQMQAVLDKIDELINALRR